MAQTTITVWLGSTDTILRKNWHCVYCGKTCAMVNGTIVAIVKGDVQTETLPSAVEVMCRCRTKYVFLD